MPCTSEPAQGRPPYQALMGQVWSRLSDRGGRFQPKPSAWSMAGKRWSPSSPLLRHPAPLLHPAGALRDLVVFLGPIGQIPWALVGGGVWGLIRVPTLSVFPSLFLRSAGKKMECNKYTRCPGDELRLGSVTATIRGGPGRRGEDGGPSL